MKYSKIFLLLFLITSLSFQVCLAQNENSQQRPADLSTPAPDRPAQGNWPEIRSDLERIYLSREFSHLNKRVGFPWQEYVHKLLQKLWHWLGKHSGSLEGLPLKGLGYLAYGLIITVCVLLIIWIKPGGFSLPRLGPGRKQPPEPAEEKLEKRWRDYRRQAYQLYREQAFRDAVRVFFISVLWEGHDRGWWVYEPQVTNREHLRWVLDPVPRREALQSLISIYEAAWYGIGRPGPEDYQACEVCLKNMETAG